MKTYLRFKWLMLALFGLATITTHADPPPLGGSNTNLTLGTWPFSDTNWLGSQGHTPLSFTNIANVAGGDSNALRIDSTNTAYLQYRIVESDGTTNLLLDRGSVMFWFRPSWSSTNQGGTGPGDWSRLLEVGTYTTNASHGWWSIYCDPAGTNLFFGAQTNNGSGATYLSAPISWTNNLWHQIALTYSATNSSLYLDGQPAVTNGLGVTYWPGPDIQTNGFFIGSDSSGTPATQAHGDCDDLTTYNYPLDPLTVSGNFNVFGIVYYGTNIFQFTRSAPFTPSTNSDGGFNVVSGTGYLQYVGASANCITNSQVYLTNVIASPAANGSTTITFTIAGGTNNVAYDVFGTAPLAGNNITNSQWFWLGQGYTCSTYTLTNQPNFQAYYLLGLPQDSDADGLTDAYETLVSKTDPHNPDTDGDGVSDGDEVQSGTNPFTPNSAIPSLLNISTCPQ
jgi:Concanavalin A-like lectin/glucanases superfamily/Bacterial TSP3 repeat